MQSWCWPRQVDSKGRVSHRCWPHPLASTLFFYPNYCSHIHNREPLYNTREEPILQSKRLRWGGKPNMKAQKWILGSQTVRLQYHDSQLEYHNSPQLIQWRHEAVAPWGSQKSCFLKASIFRRRWSWRVGPLLLITTTPTLSVSQASFMGSSSLLLLSQSKAAWCVRTHTGIFQAKQKKPERADLSESSLPSPCTLVPDAVHYWLVWFANKDWLAICRKRNKINQTASSCEEQSTERNSIKGITPSWWLRVCSNTENSEQCIAVGL